DGVEDDVGASVISVDARLIVEQHVLAREAEDREVAGEFQDAALADDDVGVRVGAADAGNRALLQKLIPLGEVFLWGARETKQRKARIDWIHDGGDDQVNDCVFSPDGVIVENFNAIVIRYTPITPPIAQTKRMGNEVYGVRAAGGRHQGAGVAAGTARPGVV